MARYTIGRILPIFQGSWDSTQSYDKLDIVLKDTISYASLIDNNTTTPSENNANWQVVCRGATAEEVVESIEGGQLQLGRLDVDDDIQAGAVYVNGVPVATTNDIKYGIDEVSIDQTGIDRVNIETTMIGGGGSSSSILAATSTRAGVMSAADKTKLDSISPQGDHPVEVEADGNGDLDVSDEAGYVLGRFENGHIRTKNFYSGNIYTKSEVDNLIGSGGGGGVTPQQLQDGLATKQDTLVSGTNIKTINNNSILGSGNITISGIGGTSSYLGKSFSILGDSYSTFKGYVTNENSTQWYPTNDSSCSGYAYRDTNLLTDVTQTWWYKYAKETNSKLIENNSWSGAPVSYDGWGSGTTDAIASSFYTRCEDVGKPDICFIFGGTNDSSVGVALGDYKYSDFTDADMVYFRPSVARLIDRMLYSKYLVGTKLIWVINGRMNTSYKTSVSTICDHYGIPVCTVSNFEVAGGHPTPAGMESIKNQLITFISNLE